MKSRAAELGSLLRDAFADPPGSAGASGEVRRRLVVAMTILLGAVALGAALATRPGDPLFYLASVILALIWLGGGLASGPMRLGRMPSPPHRRPWAAGLAVGLLLLATFLLGSLLVGWSGWLRSSVDELLNHARFGSLLVVVVITAVTGVGEEVFFRGALFAALPPRLQIIGSAAIYTACTLVSGVPLLVFAAACLGVVTALLRRATAGVLGPIVCHVTWSLGMLVLLPHALDLGAQLQR